MAALEEPKKPQGAYFLYVNATRKAVQEELKTTDFGPVTKAQADRWKALAAGEKAKYEKQAADAKGKYEEELKAYKEAGGVVGQKRKEKADAKKAKADKAAKKEANADRPKKPAGGAFGVWLNKNRKEIQKSLPEGSPCTAVAPVASSRWKAMSEADKAPFEKEYSELKAKYDTEIKAWKEAKGAAAEEEGEEEDGEGEEQKGSASEASPEKKAAKTATPKKRSAPASKSEEAPAKKAKGSGKGKKAAPATSAIDAEIMKQATALNMGGALKNLAERKDVSHFSADKLLDALKTNGGLVNKARAVLLGS